MYVYKYIYIYMYVYKYIYIYAYIYIYIYVYNIIYLYIPRISQERPPEWIHNISKTNLAFF